MNFLSPKSQRYLLTLLASFLVSFANAADFYWVGGTGAWSEYATHWATSSGGGAFHNQVPSPNDDVYFDANSFTSASQTLTLNVNAFAKNMYWTSVANDPTFTLGNFSLTTSGDFVSSTTPYTFNQGSGVFDISGDFKIDNCDMSYTNTGGNFVVDSSVIITSSDLYFNNQCGTITVGKSLLVSNSNPSFFRMGNGGNHTYGGDVIFTEVDINLIDWRRQTIITGNFALIGCNTEFRINSTYNFFCHDFTISDSATKFTHTYQQHISGSMYLDSQTIWNHSSNRYTYFSSSSAETIELNGIELRNVNFNNGGTWTFQDDFTSLGYTYFYACNINSNGHDLNFGNYMFAHNGNAKNLDFSNSYIKVRYNWYMATASATQVLTMTNSTLDMGYATSSTYLQDNGHTYNVVKYSAGNVHYHRTNNCNFDSIRSTGDIYNRFYVENNAYNNNNFGVVTLTYTSTTNESAMQSNLYGTNTYADFTVITNSIRPYIYVLNNNTFEDVNLGSGTTWRVQSGYSSTVQSFTGNGTCYRRIVLWGNNTSSFITDASGINNVDYVLLQGLNANGGATFNLTNVLEYVPGTGWNSASVTTKDFYWIGNTGNWGDTTNWSFTSGGTGANCLPTRADNVVL